MLAYVLLNGTRFTCKDEAPKWHVLEANLGPGSIEVKDGHAIGGLGYIRAPKASYDTFVAPKASYDIIVHEGLV